MSSGWDVYYVVFLSAGMALGIPAVLGLISRALARASAQTHAKTEGRSPRPVFYPSEELLKRAAPGKEELGQRMNTRFFISANAALLLLGLAFLLIPCIVTLRGDSGHGGLVRGVLAIVSIAGFAALGLLYAARKGDLGWLKSFRDRS